MRILLVEDDDFIRECIEICLLDEGHAVDSAATVQAAREHLTSDQCPDLLVSDFNLGVDADGVDIADEMRQRCPCTPVLIFSGNPPAAQEKLGRRPNSAFLPKPFVKQELLAAMERAFSP
jgi:DNA-binding response OmpR family regulator